MPDLDDLIDFIKENPPSSELVWWKGDWEKQLTDLIPSWTDIVAKSLETSTEWEKIERSRPRKSYDYLCEALVGVIGMRLAQRWCRSGVDDQKAAATEWLSEHFSMWSEFNQNTKASAIEAFVRQLGRTGFLVWNLNPIVWSDIDETMKSALLTALFREYPGEPFQSSADFLQTWESAVSAKGDDSANGMPVSPPPATRTGYVPAPEIDHLRNIMREAGDDTWLARLDGMILRRVMASRNRNMTPQPQRLPYVPDSNQRELIARLLEMTRRSGYLPAALPSILISSETPPIFVAYPELEEDPEFDEPKLERTEREEEDRFDGDFRKQRRGNREDRIPTRDRRRPETISVEDLLGVYQPRHEQIVIYERGIRWRRNRYDQEWLRAVVLIHEIGHWITHALPKPGTPTWATDLYVLGETDVHEGWAQLMTWWIARQVGGRFRETFEDLNRSQSPPYHVFRQFENEPTEGVMASLEKLRLLTWPARLQDWREAMG